MQSDAVKPYLQRIKDWKIRNMVMLYLEAREQFLACRKELRKGLSISFNKMLEICDILYEVKEDHHLIFKKLQDPKRNKFEPAQKFMPCKWETEFMNNIGLLFHKVMVARELKYQLENYVEQDDAYQRNRDNLNYHLKKIDELFNEGVEILKHLIARHRDNILLLTLLLEDPERTRRHFGQDAWDLIAHFADGRGLEELYYAVGKYYAENGWRDKAIRMLEKALKLNPKHPGARKVLSGLQASAAAA